MAVTKKTTRTRKSHAKSRNGCGNCKIRRVKCDESKPVCQQCQSFHVACDYTSKTEELHVSGVTSFQLDVPKSVTPPEPEYDQKSLLQSIDGMVDAPLYLHVDDSMNAPSICYIGKAHIDLLKKFYHRSVLSIGAADTVHIYQEVLTRMATRHSFALHAVLTFTLLHDRILFDPIGTKASAAEAFHSYHAAAMFNDRLFGPIQEEEKDAMWGVAALIGASAFAAFDATCAQEAWPLKQPEISDLDWLKMSDGKKAVWKLADPCREGSVFRPAVLKYMNRKQSDATKKAPDPVLDQASPLLVKIFGLDDARQKSELNNAYLNAASIVHQLVSIECNRHTVLWFLGFTGHMEPAYRAALEEKDPYAMVLLVWWYALILPYNSWWQSRRALFEGQAVCIYLNNTLPAEHELRTLLDFPRSVFGLDRPELHIS